MLHAISQASLDDDVFREDHTTTSLETFIASLTGHEAALLVLSGTMGNQLCIRTHLTHPPHSIVADARSHVLGWEAGGIALLSSALAIPITPRNGHHLTLADVERHTVLSSDIHACPTRLIALENTLGGSILPLSVCQEISHWARAQEPPIPLHLDGARLWDAVAAGAGSLKDYCACFDSVSLCFSKGLGAPIGSIIVGGRGFIEKSRHFRKAIGGGTRQSGVIAAAARISVEENFWGGELARSREVAMRVAGMWEDRGGKVNGKVETGMCWLDLEGSGVEEKEWVKVGVEEGVKLYGKRLVCHYQISDEAVERLGSCMDHVLLGKRGKRAPPAVNGGVKCEIVEQVADEQTKKEME